MAKEKQTTIEKAKATLRKAGYFVDTLWTLEDIISRAEEMERPIITKKQAKDIMGLMAKSHDANIGVNWEFIDSVTEIYLEGRK